jgi:hypothetical protein
MSRPAGAERCFLSLSPTLRPWIAVRPLRARRPTWRSVGARASQLRRNCMQKPTLLAARNFRRGAPRVFLSQAGPRSELCFLKLGITSGLSDGDGSPWSMKKATRWVALVWLGMRARGPSRHASQRGRERYCAQASRRRLAGTASPGRPGPLRRNSSWDGFCSAWSRGCCRSAG